MLPVRILQSDQVLLGPDELEGVLVGSADFRSHAYDQNLDSDTDGGFGFAGRFGARWSFTRLLIRRIRIRFGLLRSGWGLRLRTWLCSAGMDLSTSRFR